MKPVVLGLLLVLAPAMSLAEDAAVDQTARAIYSDFMSPYCPGLLLADCRSQPAVELRAQIRGELAAGKSDAEVRAALEATYGEKLRAAPPASGFGLWAWITPAIFVVIGAGFVLLWAQRRRDWLEAEEAPPASDGDPALEARLARELRSFDAG
jgi:cytochrome c-type biogenesis protein CcmH